MPVYRFIVQGEGIPTEDGSIGFFASRAATADDEPTAQRAVLAPWTDWRVGEAAGFSPGLPPALRAVETWMVEGRDSGPKGGWCFSDDLEAIETALRVEREAARRGA